MTAPSPRERLAEFARLFADEKYEPALAVVEALLKDFPAEAPLHWHRARALEKLERWEDARAAVKQVLKLKPDYAPAWVLRAELGEEEGTGYDPVPDLRRAISLDPKSARARFILATVLQGEEATEQEAQAQMEQAIALDPTLHEAYITRSRWRRGEAYADPESEAGPDIITSFVGLKYKRSSLEAALADVDRAIAIKPEPSYRFARAEVLHMLQRFDEALAEHDRLQAQVPADHPMREFYLEARRKSENQGAGERDEMAKMLENALESSGDKEKGTLAYDNVAAMLRSAAQGMRDGRNVAQAMEDFVSDDPDEITATSIAWQVKQLGEEATPHYVPTEAAEYPAHQRKFEAEATRQLAKLGFSKLGDYDPVHLAITLARKQMLSIYVRGDGRVTAAAFSIKPKWPGFLGWVVLVFKRIYRTANVIEFETAFADDTVISTNNAGGISPYGYGPKFLQEKFAPGTPAAVLLKTHLERVAAHAKAHPAITMRTAHTFDDVVRQQAAQTAMKNDYRRSIGFVTDEELRSLMGDQFEKFAPKVKAKLKLMAADAA